MRNTTSISSVLSLRRECCHRPWPGLLGWRAGRRFVSRIRLPLLFLSCFDYRLIIFFRLPPLLPRQLLRLRPCYAAKKFRSSKIYSRRILKQGNFKYWGNMVASRVRQALNLPMILAIRGRWRFYISYIQLVALPRYPDCNIDNQEFQQRILVIWIAIQIIIPNCNPGY